MLVRTDLQLAMHNVTDFTTLRNIDVTLVRVSDTWLSKETTIAVIEAESTACLQKKNVSCKWDWNFILLNMQSSATTRSQATSMQFPYDLASYQGCLYSGIGYTQSTWTGFNLYYPVGHSELSRSILVGRLTLGITTRIAYTQNTRMVCRYITRKKIRQVHSRQCSSSTAKGLGTRLLCTVTNQEYWQTHAGCR